MAQDDDDDFDYFSFSNLFVTLQQIKSGLDESNSFFFNQSSHNTFEQLFLAKDKLCMCNIHQTLLYVI